MSPKPRREVYRIEVRRDEDGRVEGFELRVTGLGGAVRTTRLSGYKAPSITHSLFELLKDYGVTGRQWAGAKPIPLDGSDSGPHGELLLRAVKPVRRSDRVASIAEAISGMSREEALYWCAKSARPNGLRALRLICDRSRR
jgi:hypothetical protein